MYHFVTHNLRINVYWKYFVTSFCFNKKKMWYRNVLRNDFRPELFSMYYYSAMFCQCSAYYKKRNCIFENHRANDDDFHKKWCEIILMNNDRLLPCGLCYLLSFKTFLMLMMVPYQRFIWGFLGEYFLDAFLFVSSSNKVENRDVMTISNQLNINQTKLRT